MSKIKPFGIRNCVVSCPFVIFLFLLILVNLEYWEIMATEDLFIVSMLSSLDSFESVWLNLDFVWSYGRVRGLQESKLAHLGASYDS
ncbi:hypothetical protein RJT34_15261 [Clitoria ternatea]|uniref:Transmembrane protein n=1 Tax=Clitoria ternatea TaxID=43366 RepID=A0AAN9JTR3_CLITE